MMSSDILVPPAGESINEGELAIWHKKDGETVNVDDIVAEIETEKASLEVRSPISGKLSILVEAGESVKVGQKIATVAEGAGAPISAGDNKNNDANEDIHATLSARKLLTEHDLDKSQINVTEHPGRIGKQDVELHLQNQQRPSVDDSSTPEDPKPANIHHDARAISRRRMTRLRQTVAKRLTEANQTAALLTTFNEVDMSAVMELRKKYKEKYEKIHGIKLGFMSFFVKAACDALKLFPVINSFIDGQEIVEHHYADVGIAVATKKGLIVPLLRNAEKMSFVEIEKAILDFSKRGSEGKVSLEEMSGGTFTITNGGTFGSMLSTPIVNFPQSAILGMHNIVQRPVAINGQVEIRPIMYLALTYDHRLIDGAEAVRFLYTIKERIEDPARMLVGI